MTPILRISPPRLCTSPLLASAHPPSSPLRIPPPRLCASPLLASAHPPSSPLRHCHSSPCFTCPFPPSTFPTLCSCRFSLFLSDSVSPCLNLFRSFGWPCLSLSQYKICLHVCLSFSSHHLRLLLSLSVALPSPPIFSRPGLLNCFPDLTARPRNLAMDCSQPDSTDIGPCPAVQSSAAAAPPALAPERAVDGLLGQVSCM